MAFAPDGGVRRYFQFRPISSNFIDFQVSMVVQAVANHSCARLKWMRASETGSTEWTCLT